MQEVGLVLLRALVRVAAMDLRFEVGVVCLLFLAEPLLAVLPEKEGKRAPLSIERWL